MRALAALLHLYIGLRLLVPLELPLQVAGAAGLAALFALLPKGWSVRGRTRWAVLAPWIALGFFSWLLILTFARDLSLLVSWMALDAAARAAWSHDSAVAVLVATPLITLVGYFMARRVAPVRRINIPLAGLAPELEGFTIAQISDVHVGPTIKGDFVQAIVDRVNRLQADMVAITGDLVDGSVRELSPHTAPLGKLESRHGTYVVTGNHEYYSGASSWIREFRRLGAHVLLNEHVVLERAGARVVVAGVTDYSAHHFDPAHRSDPWGAIADAPPDSVRILLAHQPRSAHHAEEAGYHLQLSGHTHGGQFWPWNLFVRLQQPFTAGLNRLGQLWVYINRGTGYWGPPMRFGIPSEITLLRLVRSKTHR
jgi:uncharacterized protein